MQLLQRAKQFLIRDIWTEDVANFAWWHRALVLVLRALALAVRGISRHDLSIWASSLTYITLISLVPFFALVIGLGTQLGVPDKALDSLSESLQEAQFTFLQEALESFKQMDLNALGIISVIVLLWAMVKVLTRVERAFNEVWGVERGRSLARRLSNYISVAVLAPLLVLGGMTLTASMMSSAMVQKIEDVPAAGTLLQAVIGFTPYAANFLALTLLYWLMPNTRVRLSSAFVGAVFAAFLWQVAQKIFFNAQVGISSMGIVYGAFAALPIFLIWVYFSWLIALLGAEICYSVQHAGSYSFERLDHGISPASLEKSALRIAVLLAHRFETGKGAAEADDIAVALGIPARLTNQLLGRLAQRNIVAVLDSGGYQMADSPRRVTASDVVLSLRSDGAALPPRGDVPPGATAEVDEVMGNAIAELDKPLVDLLPVSPADSPDPHPEWPRPSRPSPQ
jgi:membrane protein